MLFYHKTRIREAAMEDLEIIQSREDKRDADILQNARRSGEFEDWEVVKKRLLKEGGAVEDAGLS